MGAPVMICVNATNLPRAEVSLTTSMPERIDVLNALELESPTVFTPELRLMVLGVISALAAGALINVPGPVWSAVNRFHAEAMFRANSATRRDPAETA